MAEIDPRISPGLDDSLLPVPGPPGDGDASHTAVARPGSPAELAEVLQAAAASGSRVYPVGAAPAGRFVAPGMLLDLSRLNAVTEVDTADMLLVAQAGARLEEVETASNAAGLTYPPALVGSRETSLGGHIARGGVRGPSWGPARESLLALRIALPDGTLLSAGSRAIKNATGYSLPQAISGSWGALAVIVEATIRLTPAAGQRESWLVGFADPESAALAAVRLCAQRHPPSAAELLDRRALSLACPELISLLAPAFGAALLVLLEASYETDSSRAADELVDLTKTSGALDQIRLSASQATAAWEARREVLSRALQARLGTASFALACAPSAMQRLLGQVRRLAGARADIALVGGAGSGSLIVAVVGTAADVALGGLCRDLACAAREAGGRLASAEGAGVTFDEWLDLAMTPPAASAFRLIKSSLDPRDILRPAAYP